jgi:hypothetical protein
VQPSEAARRVGRGERAEADGSHEWSIVLPRHPLPPKIVILVLDRDGTVRRASNP